MKGINNFIYEKLKINKNTKISKRDYIEPEDIEDMETPGKDYFDEDVIIVGKPFTKKDGDKNYLDALRYIRKSKYLVNNDLGDIDNLDDYDDNAYFVYAAHKGDKELNCYTYGPDGVYGVDE